VNEATRAGLGYLLDQMSGELAKERRRVEELARELAQAEAAVSTLVRRMSEIQEDLAR
jgi:hypothetical protein